MLNHLSITSINMFLRCGHQGYLRYVRGIKKSPGIAALVGRSVDKSVEINLQSKIDNGILLASDQVQDIARDTMNQEWEEGVLLSEEEKAEGDKKVKGKCIDKSVRLASLHHDKLAPIIKPVRVARKWELEIQGFPYNITGIMDIQEETAIRDTKTSKVKKTGAAHKSEQLTIYALAGKFLDKKDYKLFLDYLVDNKTPITDVQETIREQKDFERLFRKLEVVAEMLQKEVFPPCNSEINYLCCPEYCGYYGQECKYT